MICAPENPEMQEGKANMSMGSCKKDVTLFLTHWGYVILALTLQWRHYKHDGVSNHQPLDCLLNLLFRRRSNKTSKLRVTGLYEGNSPVTGEFPAQRANNAENVSIWWRHHDPSIWYSHALLRCGCIIILSGIMWSIHRYSSALQRCFTDAGAFIRSQILSMIYVYYKAYFYNIFHAIS